MIPHSKPAIGPEESAAVVKVLQSGHLAQGVQVRKFEEACAEFLGRKYALAVSSGTAALHLALGALGIEPSASVAMPSYSCAALMTAVRLHGAAPRLCDIGADFNLAPAAITHDGDAAIVPSLFGAPALVPPHCNRVIEDVAQAFGGPAGRATPIAVTSFYATKLMTTGEGGMVFTDDAGIAEYVADCRDYDNRDDFKIRYPYKMTDVQAAIGLAQLAKLPDFIRRRRELAQQYSEALRHLPMGLPAHPDHVFFRYVVTVPCRDDLETWLRARHVEAKRPVYRPAHHYLGGDFPASQRAHEQALSLPIYPALCDSEVEYITTCLVDYWESRRKTCSGPNTGREPILQSA